MDKFPPFPDRDELAAMNETRRRFHLQPELSWIEYQTTAQLCFELEALGFTIAWGQAVPRPSAGEPPRCRAEPACLSTGRGAVGPGQPLPAFYVRQPDRTGGDPAEAPARAGARLRFDIDVLPIEECSDTSHRPAAEEFVSENFGVMHACGHAGHHTSPSAWVWRGA